MAARIWTDLTCWMAKSFMVIWILKSSASEIKLMLSSLKASTWLRLQNGNIVIIPHIYFTIISINFSILKTFLPETPLMCSKVRVQGNFVSCGCWPGWLCWGLNRGWCWRLFREDISASIPFCTECLRVTSTHIHTFAPSHPPECPPSDTAFQCKQMKASQPLSPHGEWLSVATERSRTHAHSLLHAECEELKTGRATYSTSHTNTHAAGCELEAGMVAEEIVVSLSGGAPWGFRLQGGAEQQKPLQVAKV